MLLVAFLACTGAVISGKDSGGETGTTNPSNIELPDLVINEFLSSNDTILADEAGEFDDWLELYNYGDTLINFEGLYMTDDSAAPTKWALPADQGLAPGEYLVIWCDGQPEQGALHADVKLNKGGDLISIYKAVDGKKPVRVDGVEWTKETPDISAARVPDGSTNWVHQTPTPGATNGNG